MYKKKATGELVFSPSDLTSFWESRFASWMDRFAIEVPDMDVEADPDDVLMKTLQEKGYKHEESEISRLREEGRDVRVIDTADASKAKAHTIAAMKEGVEVIFQARLELGSFAGWADFLVRVEGESKLGSFHYEVWDTKLSGKLKGTYAIQLCAYAEMLEDIQGIKPRYMRVVLGNGTRNSLNLIDYFGYYQLVKEDFLSFHKSWDKNQQPDPERYRSYGKWQGHAEDLLHKQDSLSQIAGISVNQIKNFAREGITTITGLINTNKSRIPRMSDRVFNRLKHQASLQKSSEGKDQPEFEVLDHSELPRDHGLKRLPAASNSDVFFDIEGYPLVEGGLEYLWGNSYREHGKIKFKDFWAHNEEQEKLAFEAFIDWIYARWQHDPSMHVYHYANYEIAAMHKLVGRYRTREEEVDTMITHGVFVDLYKVVKQGLRIGAPSYSIKYVEHLYRGKREGDVTSGMASVVFYDAWRQARDGDTWESSKILGSIRDYNIDDCESTLELTDWLMDLQHRARIDPYIKEVEEKTAEKDEVKEDVIRLTERLDKIGSPLAQLLSDLLGFYRREQKPKWWNYFERLSTDPSDLLTDLECLADLQPAGVRPIQEGRKLPQYPYKFDLSQECKLKKEQAGVVHHDDNISVTMTDIDYDRGIAWFRFGKGTTPPEGFTFVPLDADRSGPLLKGVIRFVERWLDEELSQDAITGFLIKEAPRIKGHQGGPLLTTSGDLSEKIKLIGNMDNTCLCIQGPPGAGKTYTASHMIADLIENGKKVGITSNSHKAIHNLMEKVGDLVEERGLDVSLVKVGGEADDPIFEHPRVERVDRAPHISVSERNPVIGGTAWAFASTSHEGNYDYLFIDESGQVSLANLIAMAGSSKNFVFLGDQMQLAQPVQGSHPGDSGKSILDYLLEGQATIPDDKGVFLEKTFRLHPEICSFISDTIYEGRLRPDDANAIRVFRDLADTGLPEAGIAYIPIEHEGNSQASEEEVEVIQSLTQKLLGREIYGKDGKIRVLTLDDILYVAPYNLQVRKLKSALGDSARVGSVDKFQGQEASVVIMSMCASNAESARGINFLFDKNRMNVALSRAETLAIVVGHPGLSTTYTPDIGKMTLINLYGLLVKNAKTSTGKTSNTKQGMG